MVSHNGLVIIRHCQKWLIQTLVQNLKIHIFFSKIFPTSLKKNHHLSNIYFIVCKCFQFGLIQNCYCLVVGYERLVNCVSSKFESIIQARETICLFKHIMQSLFSQEAKKCSFMQILTILKLNKGNIHDNMALNLTLSFRCTVDEHEMEIHTTNLSGNCKCFGNSLIFMIDFSI